MIVGIGVDTVEQVRFARALDRAPRLAERLFSEDERRLPLSSLAARFAAREAVVKAIGGLHGLAFRDFPVRRVVGATPAFDPSPAARGLLQRLGIDRLHLSLTHDAGLAIAFVVAEGPGAATAPASGTGAPPAPDTRPLIDD